MISSLSGANAAYRSITAASSKVARNSDSTSFPETLPLASARISGTSVSDSLDTLTVTGMGRLLSENSLILPTISNVQKLSAELSENLGALFTEAGIDTETPVEFEMDNETGQITVKGDREDTEQITRLVNDNPEIKRRIQTVIAISSHTYQIPENLSFQSEYRNSENPFDVVSKYARLFRSQNQYAYSVRFNGKGIQVRVDGKTWVDTGVET